MSGTATVFPKAADAFHVLHESLCTMTSLLKAVLALPCVAEWETEEFGDVSTLLKLAKEHAGKAVEAAEEGEAAYNGLSSRLRFSPEAGDPIPAELLTGLVGHAIEASETENWQKSATEIGQMLHLYAGIHPELTPLVSSWINFVRKRGGDIRLLEYPNGQQEVTWNGTLNGETTQGSCLEVVSR